MAIGTNTSALMFLDWKIRALKSMSPVSSIYRTMNGVSAVMPSASIPAPTIIAGRSVALRPDPITYAPAENIIRCHGMSTSFHFTTPMPGIRAMMAPMRTTTSAETPCRLSVTHMTSTPTNMAIDLNSSTVILPMELSS